MQRLIDQGPRLKDKDEEIDSPHTIPHRPQTDTHTHTRPDRQRIDTATGPGETQVQIWVEGKIIMNTR